MNSQETVDSGIVDPARLPFAYEDAPHPREATLIS
jgi:hypothetical protein